MTKILITGGAGYIGGYLTDLLVAEKYDVTVYDNLFFETRYLKEVKFINGDITDYNLLNKTLENNYDVVIWLAAVVGDGACSANPELTLNTNFESIKNLLKNYSNKIIFMSTCSVYGHSTLELDEESEKKPLSLYAKSKIFTEEILLKASNRNCVFRLGTLFGLGDSVSRIRLDLVVNILSMKAAIGEKLKVFGGEQWRPLLHVRDVAEAIIFSIKNNIEGTYNLSYKNYKIRSLGDEIIKIFNKDELELEITDNFFEDERNYRVSSDKFRSVGWLPKYNLKDGILQIKNIVEERRIKNLNDKIYSNANYTKEIYK